jgi:hypothetical protein
MAGGPARDVQGHDPGVDAVGLGGGNAWGPATPLGAMGADTRTQGCAVRGCVKPADDLVHAPEDR